ncbi:hypothetical protein PVNG_02425 [Plasmodium vivax North Korean]|uniref:AAA+ ATPase domain-containing protein n=1 Tax=Plasmodium vivax North Korean TaxID=1035514 RepID=A0A0J9TNF8_PLAVI|nr:hypothetical protein PVNG_02425 [Plasmodium vivax North Korean]
MDIFKQRPFYLDEFIGKPEIIQSLKIELQVSEKLNKPLEHTLFYGPPGVGKTSLAQIIANEKKVNIKIIPATNIQTLPDLIGVMNSLKDFDVLFIDEIHTLKPEYAEMLYSALEDNVLDLLVGKSYNSKTIREIIKECGFSFKGLTSSDLKYLLFLDRSHNNVAGLKSIIQGVNIEEATLVKKIEPYLVFKGYISKTMKGRMLSEDGKTILKEYQEYIKKNKIKV